MKQLTNELKLRSLCFNFRIIHVLKEPTAHVFARFTLRGCTSTHLHLVHCVILYAHTSLMLNQMAFHSGIGNGCFYLTNELLAAMQMHSPKNVVTL